MTPFERCMGIDIENESLEGITSLIGQIPGQSLIWRRPFSG